MNALHRPWMALLMTALVVSVAAFAGEPVVEAPADAQLPGGTVQETCLAAGLPCVDVPALVDESGDTMQGDLAFDPGFGVRFGSYVLRGSSSTSLTYGTRGVCLASVALAGCGPTYTGTSPVTVGTSTIGLSTAGCTGGETWLFGGASWSCDNVATQAELDARATQLDQGLAAANARIDATAVQGAATSAGLAAHRASADHDDRYARADHGHDVTTASSQTSFLVDSASAMVVSTQGIIVPDECPANENHTYLVQFDGYVSSFIIPSMARIGVSVSLDSTVHGPSKVFATSNATSFYADDAPFSVSKVFRNVAPGDHDFRVMASKANQPNLATAYVILQDFNILHMGWTCG